MENILIQYNSNRVFEGLRLLSDYQVNQLRANYQRSIVVNKQQEIPTKYNLIK